MKEEKAYIGDEIVEGNKRICEFMGGKKFKVVWFYVGPDGFEHESGTHLKYHSSWDWLMPVVEKISKIPLLNADGTICTDHDDTCFPITFNMPTEDGKAMFRFKGFSVHTADRLIDATWQAVVEVCEYQLNNNQNKQS